jgi:XTP/dITP diphosphohydrolase
MQVVLATHNAGKLRELQTLLASHAVEVVALASFSSEGVAETGLTFIENAILKARYAAKLSGLPAIADDSGLEVDALHGAPGIYSARYAGEHADDGDNTRKLLHALRDVQPEGRTARYRCAIALMRWDLDPAPVVCQSSWEGRILSAPRGTNGFGYDPVFELSDRPLTAAELSGPEKNVLSHRGKALRELLEHWPTHALQSL